MTLYIHVLRLSDPYRAVLANGQLESTGDILVDCRRCYLSNSIFVTCVFELRRHEMTPINETLSSSIRLHVLAQSKLVSERSLKMRG